jgi:hypothetical protein
MTHTKKQVLAEFNFGKVKNFDTLIKEYPALNLTYNKLRRWVWTPDFKEKVVLSWFESDLTDENLKVQFPNYELTRASVLIWVQLRRSKRLSSFEKRGDGLSKKRVVISEDEFNYVVQLVLDPLRRNRPKDILFELETKYKKVFTRGALCTVARTPLFRHRLLPWAFTYFFGPKGDCWVKAGTTDNFIRREQVYETILIDEMNMFLILSYPLRYQFIVDTWFKKNYKNLRVYKIHEGIPLNDNKGEFYDSVIVDTFKDSADHTITLNDKTGNFFQVTLEKIIPGSQQYENVTRLLKLHSILTSWTNDAVNYELAPGIEDHADIMHYPDSFKNKWLRRNLKKKVVLAKKLESVNLPLEEANAALKAANAALKAANASLKKEIDLLKKGSDEQKNKSVL